jgi:hypothetical protein
MDNLLKAIGLLLYIVLSPFFALVEALIFVIEYANFAFYKVKSFNAKHSKQLVSFIKQHRPHFGWSLK